MERDVNTPQSQRTTTGHLIIMKQHACKLKFPLSSYLVCMIKNVLIHLLHNWKKMKLSATTVIL